MRRVDGFIVPVVMVLLAPFGVKRPISAQQAGDPFRAKDTPQTAGFAERLYILNGGYGRSGNAQAWDNMLVPPRTPINISAYAHLIKHGNTWMLFDTSTNDIIATMPNGFLQGSVNGIRWFKTPAQTMTAQLKLIGIAPDEINLVGVSRTIIPITPEISAYSKIQPCLFNGLNTSRQWLFVAAAR